MHAFDGEKSQVHIGQRVPVQTAQLFTTTTTAPNTTPGVIGNPGSVISYEPTGLTLEFTPQVYPNQDVQVKMSIKSNDVAGATGLTPTFTERTLSGTARIQNNQTMMIASVSTDQQTQGRSALPLVGLVPVLGRLFTAPSKDGKRTDIVVAVTPRVLRAPAITPRDEKARPSGSQQAPTTESLEAVVAEADREDQIATARMIPARVNIQLPDQETATYVPAPKSLVGGPDPLIAQPLNVSAIQSAPPIDAVSLQGASPLSTLTDPRVKQLSLSNIADARVSGNRQAELRLVTERDKLRSGEKITVQLMLQSEETISFAVVKLRFDPAVISIHNISTGGLYQNVAGPQIAPSSGKPGELALLISGATARGSGDLLTFTVEARDKGETSIDFVRDAVHLITPEGLEITTRLGPMRMTVE